MHEFSSERKAQLRHFGDLNKLAALEADEYATEFHNANKQISVQGLGEQILQEWNQSWSRRVQYVRYS
jgi:hypothetical protein